MQGSDNIVSFPDRRGGARNAEALSVLAVLQDQLALARSGKLRSIALASVSTDGDAIVTRCSCATADLDDLAEILHGLANEMSAGGPPSAQTA